MNTKPTLVVIGNGMVGQYFLSQLTESPLKETHQIVTFCEEIRPAYDRVHLSEFFAGKTAEDLSLVPNGFFEQSGITIHLNDKVISVNRANKTVTSEKGITIPYDKVVFATGSYAFVPPIIGNNRPSCLVYRTIEDLEQMVAAAKIGTVVGGRLLRLEAAKALKDLGLKTHVVQFAPRLMEMQMDEAGGAMLRHKIENLGIRVHTSKNTREIVAGENCLNKMYFVDGEELETDLILFSAGIRPRDELARSSGQCEWKTTLEDESKLKRFRHFVNSDQRDENVIFVEKRGQIRPANEGERKHFKLTEVA